MIEWKRLDHVLITVPPGKKEEARKFYSGTLRLRELPGEHPRGAIWFQIGDVELHIREEEAGNISDRHPAFEVLNLKAAIDFLEAQGVDLSFSSEIDGRKRCFFRDPFANRFELLSFY